MLNQLVHTLALIKIEVLEVKFRSKFELVTVYIIIYYYYYYYYTFNHV